MFIPENAVTEEFAILDSEFDDSEVDIVDIAHWEGIALSFRSSDDESW